MTSYDDKRQQTATFAGAYFPLQVRHALDEAAMFMEEITDQLAVAHAVKARTLRFNVFKEIGAEADGDSALHPASTRVPFRGTRWSRWIGRQFAHAILTA